MEDLYPALDAAPRPASAALSESELRVIRDLVSDGYCVARETGHATTILGTAFSSVMRHLGVSAPHLGGATARAEWIDQPRTQLEHVTKMLDVCLAIFSRRRGRLNTEERRIEILLRATRRYCAEAATAYIR